MEKLTIHIRQSEGGKYIIVVDEDPTLVEACMAEGQYDNPNTALGHFMFQLSCVIDLDAGVKLDISLEEP